MTERLEPIIGDCPRDGKDYEPSCGRCGSSVGWEDCDQCNGTGCRDADDDFSNEECDVCDGEGGWYLCLSSAEWCNANPLDGRADVKRGEIEWYEVNER